tara:strand:- start:87 stop:407 length:321 start_codon:yes stop_codon:yes gene_type:complete
MKKNLPTQDSVKWLKEETLRNILSCVGGVYYNKYKLRLESKKKGNKMKRYNTMRDIGKSRYVVNYHDGIKKHEDGSDFFDIAIQSNKINHNNFIKRLVKEGYKEKR